MSFRIERVLAGIIGAYALIVIVGWIFDMEWLTGVFSIGIPMKFITAVLFFFAALGLYCVSRVIERGDEVAFVALPGISIAVFLVVIALFVGRALGTPTGIEDLFLHIPDPVDFSGSLLVTGRPSALTLVNFFLFGSVCVAVLFPGTLRKRLAVYVGHFIFVVGIVALVGYAFGIPALYYEASFSVVPMALNTALCFVLLGVGLVNLGKIEELQ